MSVSMCTQGIAIIPT